MSASTVLPSGHTLRLRRGQLWVRDERGIASRVDWIVSRERREITVAVLPDPAEMCATVARAVCEACGAMVVPLKTITR